MRKKKGNVVNGWINLDKPVGMTSTQAVGNVRRALNAQKAGHAGTLDPLASGVLPIALGEATKTIPYCQDALKIYRFTVTWGAARDTDDAEGDIIATSNLRPTLEAIEAVLPAFLGDIEQVPPKFSAIKINGERAYDLARDGEDVTLKPRPVYIESLHLLSRPDGDSSEFTVTCGKGTYIRSLARDMAEKLGTYGYISALRREAVGTLDASHAISLEMLEKMGDSPPPENVLLPVQTVLDDIPVLAINDQEAARLKQGQKLSFFSKPDLARLIQAGLDFDEEDEALALYKGKPLALVSVKGPEIKPERVFNL